MKDRSLYQLGGACSILLGIAYLAVGLTTLLLPPALTYGNDVQSPFMYFDANRGLLLGQYWSFMAVGVLGLAVVPAASRLVQHLNEGWVRWTAALASLGFAVTILDNYWAIVETPARAAAYVVGDATVRAALTVPGGAQFIDVQGWLGYGAVGAWMLVISLLALQGGVWPRALGYVGVAGAASYFLALASATLPIYRELTLVASAAAVVLGPILYIGLGLVLRRAAPLLQDAPAFQHGV